MKHPQPSFRQQILEEFFAQSKSMKSEALLLPKLGCSSQPDLNYISVHTIADLLLNRLDIEKYLIVDARYDYEFEGGHIRSAINVTEPEKLQGLLNEANWENTPIIIHCEFSQQRGPALYR